MSYLMAPLVTSADEEPPRQDYGLEGRGAQVVVPSVVGPIVAAFLVFNRLFWRIHMVHSLAIDDLCIAAALVSQSLTHLFPIQERGNVLLRARVHRLTRGHG